MLITDLDGGESFADLTSTWMWINNNPTDSVEVSIDYVTVSDTSEEGELSAPAAPPTSLSVARVGAIGDAYSTGTGEWTITFSEAVDSVTAAEFTVVHTGDSADGDSGVVTVTGADGTDTRSITLNGITGSTGTVRVNYAGSTAAASDDAAPVTNSVTGQFFQVGITAAPGAGNLALLLTVGVLLASAGFVLRRKLVRQ